MIDRERFENGDHEYFEQLVRLHGPLVLAVTRAFGRDLDHAEDLFQEVWKHVFEKRASYDGRGSFGAWLHRLTTNICITEYRARRTRAEARERLAQEVANVNLGWTPIDPLSGAERQELQRRLHRALACLSKREYEAVTLRIFEGRPPQEVAEIMGVTQATVRSNIRHAIKRLRAIVEDPGDELPRYQSAH